MVAVKLISSQTDFSGGQVDADANRRDGAKLVRMGARIMSNWRQRNTGVIQVRPGRRAVAFLAGVRAELFRMKPGVARVIEFSSNKVAIRDLAGTTITSNTGYPWTTAATLLDINWTVTPTQIVICYPGMKPKLIKWNRAADTFSFADFAFGGFGSQRQAPFVRSLIPGATMRPGARVGSFTLTCSQAYFNSGMIGERLTLGGLQAEITAVASTTSATCAAPSGISGICVSASIVASQQTGQPFIPPEGSLTVNSIVQGSISKLFCEVGGTPSSTQINVTILGTANNSLTVGETMVGPFGRMTANEIFPFGNTVNQLAIVTWAHELMSDFSGWPSATFYSNGRLGFCDFPQRPEAVLWSSVGNYDIFWVDQAASLGTSLAGTLPSAAILEFLGARNRVRNVVDWNGDNFIFTDNGIFVVPISPETPLKPGTVKFDLISDASANGVRPLVTQDGIFFVSAAGNRISSIIRTGQQTTPYVEMDVTPYHSTLVKTPVALGSFAGDASGLPERQVYAVNSDGSMVAGKAAAGEDKSIVGWGPWPSGAGGVVKWISTLAADVLVVTQYGSRIVMEFEAPTGFLDHQVSYNSPPANLLSGGNGAFIAFASGTVTVMDGNRDLGERSVSATGFVLPKPDDDFAASTIVAGGSYPSELVPFIEEGQAGPAAMQRQRRRRIARAVLTVINSSGVTFGDRTIPPYNFGEDPTAQPVLRETTYRTRQLGYKFEPYISIKKDRPGPLTITELTLEITV